MRHTFTDLIGEAGQGAALSPEERARMQRVLSEYMAMKPFREAPVPERGGWLFALRSPVPILLTALLFVGTGGISYAAESSLPGDALYTIKTHVNEPIRVALAVTPSARADVEMVLAERRVSEAAALAAAGHLDGETSEELTENFERHAHVAQRHLEDDYAGDDAARLEAALRFEARLAEHEAVLAELSGQTGEPLASVVASVQDSRAHVAEIRADVEQGIALSDNEAIDGLRDAARDQLEKSARLARNNARSLSDVTTARISAGLTSAYEKIADGQEQLEREKAPEAVRSFLDSLSTTERLGVFIRTTSALERHAGLSLAEGAPQEPALMMQTEEETEVGFAPEKGAKAAPEEEGATTTHATTSDEDAPENQEEERARIKGTLPFTAPSFTIPPLPTLF